MAEIVLDEVDKVYPGGIKGIDNLSLDIADGEFMVLVGPSGSGKSTALRSIAGLEEITSGTISIGGRVVNDLPPKDRDIAMVFQNYALYPHMTVEQNLAFGLQQRKTPKDETRRRVLSVAKMLGLEEYLKRKPASLSGGQRQRVAMGRAIAREPQACLMDEPLSNLDAKLRVSMRGSLSQLHERLGVTTVHVIHDQVEAMTLGKRVCARFPPSRAGSPGNSSAGSRWRTAGRTPYRAGSAPGSCSASPGCAAAGRGATPRRFPGRRRS
jgi:multiple sugar transport system ATP-binding protein